jgi:excisionase family DNA binding protein
MNCLWVVMPGVGGYFRQLDQSPHLSGRQLDFCRKRRDALQIGMNRKHLSQLNSSGRHEWPSPVPPEELPLTVREAAVYLGVSIQTVYLWVERKQIPHLRVMGRNIRFLKSDLEPFRSTFRRPADCISQPLFLPANSIRERGDVEQEKL